MKTRKFLERPNFILLSVAIMLAFVACKKDEVVDEKPADYVGVWMLEKTYAPEDGGFIIKDVINFSENSFTEVAKTKDSNNLWIDLVGRKGTFTVSNGEMIISLTEVGTTGVDPVSGGPNGVITYYKDKTPEFSALLIEMEMAKDYKASYTVSNNSMTLKADNNNNGSYDDQDEVNTYTRQ